jgi:hypothetical protein
MRFRAYLLVCLLGVSPASGQGVQVAALPAEIVDLCRMLKDQIINQGTDVGIDRDLLGMPRPAGGGVDIGAIECDSGAGGEVPLVPMPPSPPPPPEVPPAPKPPKPKPPPVVELPKPIPWPGMPPVAGLPPMAGGSGRRLSETETWTGGGVTPPPAPPLPGRLSTTCVWQGQPCP